MNTQNDLKEGSAEPPIRAVSLDNPAAIQYYQLCTLKGAVKLEKLGMKHSSGRSARKHACQVLGLKPGTRHDTVVAKIEEVLAKMKNSLHMEG